jgi:Kef-type K+ transport system membrane component KefB
MSLLLSQRYSTWQEFGFLLAFIAIVGTAIGVGTAARPPRLLAFLERQMHASTQLPVRITMLLLAALFVLAETFGFESIFGAFAAGMVVGQATHGGEGKPFREKIEAVSFGWFYPFFFVSTGIKFNVATLGQNLTTMLMVPTFVILILIIRGVPVFLYCRSIRRTQDLPFAFASAVPSLSVIVVITEIGVKAGSIHPDIAAALVGAALLSVLLFPTIAGVLLGRTPVPDDGTF